MVSSRDSVRSGGNVASPPHCLCARKGLARRRRNSDFFSRYTKIKKFRAAMHQGSRWALREYVGQMLTEVELPWPRLGDRGKQAECNLLCIGSIVEGPKLCSSQDRVKVRGRREASNPVFLRISAHIPICASRLRLYACDIEIGSACLHLGSRWRMQFYVWSRR